MYNPTVRLGGPKYSIPKKTSKSQLREGPGPGQYSLRFPTGSPCYKFAHQKARKHEHSEPIPGPGSYEVKSTIGAVASYAYK